jgi:galactokinase
MDQAIATLGKRDHVLLFDCRSKEAQHIRFADPSISVLIINSNVKHKLAASEYPVRHSQCKAAAQHFNARSLREVTSQQLVDAQDALDPVIYRRARHVIGEIARTMQMADRIRNGDWQSAGRLMYESHNSLRSDFEVSCAELDAIVEIARKIGVSDGVYGCRMTGGGFGGCAVALIETSAEAEITERLTREYLARTKMTPTVFSSRPAAGASILRSGGP